MALIAGPVTAEGAVRARTWSPRLRRLAIVLLSIGVGGLPRAAVAGDISWQAAVDLNPSAPEAPPRDLDLLAMTDGSLRAVWVEDHPGAASSLWSAGRPAGTLAWQAAERVASLEGGGPVAEGVLATPRLAEDPAGRLHAIWLRRQTGGASVWHAEQRPGWSAWSVARRVDNGADVDRADPDLAVDPYGVLHAIWSEGRDEADIVYAFKVPGEHWSAPSRLNTPADGVQRRPVLAAAPDGNLYAAWEDTREGRSDIAASRLPPGGDVWWPNAILSADVGPAAQRFPAIAVDEAGHPVVAWLDLAGLGRIRGASLPAPDGFWQAEGPWVEPRLGALGEMDLVAGPSGLRALLWTESRTDASGARLFAASVGANGVGAASRVDAARGLGQAQDPRAVLDRDGKVQVVWLGLRAGEAEARARSSGSETPLAVSTPQTLVGRLLYIGRPIGCPLDAFALVDCDGQWLSYVRASGPALAPFLGSWVRVTGGLDQGMACRPLRADTVQLQGGPCPRNLPIVTGLLRTLDRPVDDGQVMIGSDRAATGPLGRYALALDGPGRADLVLTAPCALERRIRGVELIDGLNQLPSIALRAGDVDGNCSVDLRDIVQVARQQGLPTDLAAPRCIDLDRDGVVSLSDLALVAAAYGSRCDGGLPLVGASLVDSRAPAAYALWMPFAGSTGP